MIDFTTTNVYEYGKEHPLTRILEVKEYRQAYTVMWKRLINAFLKVGAELQQRAYVVRDTARKMVQQDEWHQQCLSLTSNDFEASFDGDDIGHIHGIMPFIQKRAMSALQQLDH